MINVKEFSNLVGKKIVRFFIITWPPFCEESMSDIDMSVGFELEGYEGFMFQIRIDKEDNWTPVVLKKKINKVFEWSFFERRMLGWMKGEIEEAMYYECFDATQESQFKFISVNTILDIKFITLQSDFNPFAVKIIFSNDHIVISPITDGSTIETLLFNHVDNVDNYRKLGRIKEVGLIQD